MKIKLRKIVQCQCPRNCLSKELLSCVVHVTALPSRLKFKSCINWLILQSAPPQSADRTPTCAYVRSCTFSRREVGK